MVITKARLKLKKKNTMFNIIVNFLKGKKTYIMAACLAFSTFAYALNWIDAHTYAICVGLFGSGSAAALKAGQSK